MPTRRPEYRAKRSSAKIHTGSRLDIAAFWASIATGWGIFVQAITTFLYNINPANSELPDDHRYIPRSKTDSRGPCPAMNTLANHGYLPRNGRNVTWRQFIKAQQDAFNTSWFLAAFLTFTGYYLLKQWGVISLDNIRRHNRIEHVASVVHGDPDPIDAEYAPNTMDPVLLQELINDSADGEYLDYHDIARARFRRESSYIDSEKIDPLHAEIARGEMGLILGIFGGKEERMPIARLKKWLEEERFPDDWKFPPEHKQTFWGTFKTATRLRGAMRILEEEAHRANVGNPVVNGSHNGNAAR